MRLILTFIFMNCLAFGLFSQDELKRICMEEYGLSLTEKENLLREYNKFYNENITNVDSLDVLFINELFVVPDTISGVLTYNVGGEKVYSAINKTERYFSYYMKTPRIKILRTSGSDSGFSKFLYPFLLLSVSELKSAFILYIYPYLDNGNLFLFLKSDGSIVLMNEKYQHFDSIDAFMKYQFGAVDNYIDIYKFRVANQSKYYKTDKKLIVDDIKKWAQH